MERSYKIDNSTYQIYKKERLLRQITNKIYSDDLSIC